MRRLAMGGAVIAMLMAGAHASARQAEVGRTAQPAPQPDAAANRAVAQRAAALLESRYVDPDLGRRYAAALREHAKRGDYAPIADAEALGQRMRADLQAVHPDGHLNFFRVQPSPPPPPPPTAAEIAAGARSPAPGIRAMSWIEPSVAYISFEHFDDGPEAMTAVAKFLRDHAGARALVIDSRGNHGGGFPMMGLLANHFFSTPRHLANMDMARSVVDEHGAPFPIDGVVLRRTAGPKGLVRFEHWSAPATDVTAWFTTPVYYLTSHETFSAAEHMAMVLKSTGRATLIGEATGGGNHFGGTEPVGDGLELFVPVGHTTDPATGRDWEGVGVAPNVAAPPDQALAEALRRIHAGG